MSPFAKVGLALTGAAILLSWLGVGPHRVILSPEAQERAERRAKEWAEAESRKLDQILTPRVPLAVKGEYTAALKAFLRSEKAWHFDLSRQEALCYFHLHRPQEGLALLEGRHKRGVDGHLKVVLLLAVAAQNRSIASREIKLAADHNAMMVATHPPQHSKQSGRTADPTDAPDILMDAALSFGTDYDPEALEALGQAALEEGPVAADQIIDYANLLEINGELRKSIQALHQIEQRILTKQDSMTRDALLRELNLRLQKLRFDHKSVDQYESQSQADTRHRFFQTEWR
jgi:hypothetical protein